MRRGWRRNHRDGAAHTKHQHLGKIGELLAVLGVWHRRTRGRGSSVADGWQCSQCVHGGRSMPIPGELARRGHCTGQFKPDLQGAIIRKYWCPWNAAFIDEPPRVSLEDVLGHAMPSDVLQRFHSPPDEIGEVDWIEIDRCPLRYIDSKSPEYDAGWLAEIYEAVSVLNMGAPTEWLPVSPSGAFRDAVIVLKSEQDAAAALRAKNDEDW